MLWTIAFGGTNDTAAQTDTSSGIVTDQSAVSDQNSNLMLPMALKNMWMYALGNTLSRARISAPRFRPVARPLIRPIEQAANPSSRPLFEESWRHTLTFPPTEPIAILRSNSAPTGGERDWFAITFGNGNRSSPPGDLYTLRYTTSFTPTANAWSASGNITFDDTLQGGRYSIIGMDGFATGGVLGRLIFPGQPSPDSWPASRPGIIWPTANGSQGTRFFRYGYLGVFGEFESFAPPQLEVLFTAATANPEGYFDVIMIRAGARQ